MKIRGPKPKGKVKIAWSANFAYAIGLITTDGCLSNNGRHITLVSKDREQLENFSKCLNCSFHIANHISGKGRVAYRIQFSDVLFYEFLVSIGLSKAKSLILSEIKIPNIYFFDFLRGCFDGDGSSYSYWDKRWKSSYMFYISFTSGSIKFIKWLQSKIFKLSNLRGHITSSRRKNICYQLKYAKKEACILVTYMYHSDSNICLLRKCLKIKQSLAIVHTQVTNT